MIFAIVSVIASFVRLGVFTALHLAPSGYNPIRHAVSDYAVGPTRRLSTVMTWATVVTWLALAAAVWVALPSWDYRGTATMLLVILGVLFVVLPFAPTDLEEERRTTRGLLHYALAIAWFAISYSLTGDFARLITDRWGPALGGTATVLHWVALVGLAGVIVTLLIRPLRRFFGIVERGFILAISLFFLLAGIALIAA